MVLGDGARRRTRWLAEARRVGGVAAPGLLILVAISVGLSTSAGAAPSMADPSSTTSTSEPESNTPTSQPKDTTPTSRPAAIPAPQGSAKSYTLGIQGTISSGADVPALVLDKKEFCNCGNRNTEEVRALPNRLPSGGSASFAYNTPFPSVDASELRFNYKIEGTPYRLVGHALVTVFGAPEKSCRIDSGAVAYDFSPYVCSVAWGSTKQGDPKPKWTISKKPVETVTDVGRQKELMTEYYQKFCAGGDTRRCTFAAVNVKVYARDPVLAPPAIENCLDDDVVETKEREFRHEEDNSLKVELKAEASAALLDSIKIGTEIDTAYTHTWKESLSDKTSLKVPIKSGKVAGVFFSDGEADVTGSFTLNSKDKIYEVPNVIFHYPIEGSGKAKDVNDKPIRTVWSARKIGDAECGPQDHGVKDVKVPSTAKG